MTYSSTPPEDGLYRIGVYSSATCAPALYLTLKASGDLTLSSLNETNPNQQWTITLDATATNCKFTAVNKAHNQHLSYTEFSSSSDPRIRYFKLVCNEEEVSKKLWRATPDDKSRYSWISADDLEGSEAGAKLWDYQSDRSIVYLNKHRDEAINQRYVFEKVEPVNPTATKNMDIRSAFFTMTAEEARDAGPYDIIIVGSGFGGGVLANDIYKTNSQIGDAAQSVLVIERGGLPFHSHCLNASRPGGLGKDRSQQNDAVFAIFKEDYDIDTSGGKMGPDIPQNIWKGGPMYNVGGRSAAWGLFAPRIHDKTLLEHFPKDLKDELTKTWYLEAEQLLNISVPETRIIHQQLMERLNVEANPNHDVQWQWGRIASEFRDPKNFDFAEGAYSTIDSLLEIMMSKPVNCNGNLQEHDNFKMLLGAEVRSLSKEKTGSKRGMVVNGVVVRPAGGGRDVVIPLRRKGNLDSGKITGRVVLSAGSVTSPSILLRTGVAIHSEGMGGGHITDHDILHHAVSYRYTRPDDRHKIGSMKLQSYFSLPDGKIGLANISIDAASFLPRTEVADSNLPTLVIAFIIPAKLEKEENNVTLNEKEEPRVKMVRKQMKPEKRQAYIMRMEEIAKSAIGVIEDHLKIEQVKRQVDDEPYLGYLELGGVAHELGTLPMPGKLGTEPHCVDKDLKLEGSKNVFVCDLSVFPYSPEVNPSLTLAALALRLSRTLVPRDHVPGEGERNRNDIYVLNHSGEPIKVGLSNRALASPAGGDKIISPGKYDRWGRKEGVPESVFVFRLDKLKTMTSDGNETGKLFFVEVPELYLGFPKEVVYVHNAGVKFFSKL